MACKKHLQKAPLISWMLIEFFIIISSLFTMTVKNVCKKYYLLLILTEITGDNIPNTIYSSGANFPFLPNFLGGWYIDLFLDIFHEKITNRKVSYSQICLTNP